MRFPTEEDLHEATARARAKFNEAKYSEPSGGDIRRESHQFVALIYRELVSILEESAGS